MNILHCSASAWAAPLTVPLVDVMRTASRPHGRPSQTELVQGIMRCRQSDLQDFAERLAEESPCPFVIHWGGLTSPQEHVLLTQASDGSWDARVCTDEELAHWLHALGMSIRATQRQRFRQAQSQGLANLRPSARDQKPLSPSLAS